MIPPGNRAILAAAIAGALVSSGVVATRFVIEQTAPHRSPSCVMRSVYCVSCLRY